MQKRNVGWLSVLGTGLGVALLLGGFAAIAQPEGGWKRPQDWSMFSPTMEYAPGQFVLAFKSSNPEKVQEITNRVIEFGKDRKLKVDEVSKEYFKDQTTMPAARVHEATIDASGKTALTAMASLAGPEVCGNLFKYFDAGNLQGDALAQFIEDMSAEIAMKYPDDVYILEPDTGGYPKQSATYDPDWAKGAIGAQAKPVAATGVTVAVLDSGYTPWPGYTPSRSWNAVFRLGLNGSTPPSIPNPDFASADLSKIIDDYYTRGARGHGTGVASIIRGPEKIGTQPNTISLTSDAEIYPIKVCDKDMCSSVSIAMGICKAISEEKNPVGVINLSLAGPPSKIVEGAVRDALAANVLVVASAANLKTRTIIPKDELIPNEPNPVVDPTRWNETPGQYVFKYPYYPAAMSAGGSDPNNADGIVSVSAAQRTYGGFEWAIFSPKSPRWNIDPAQPRTVTNLHESVDLMAPGREVLVLPNTPMGALSNYDDAPLNNVVSGTSYAAPYVSAVAAILLHRNPSLTPVQLEKVMLDAALLHPVDCPPGVCGAGMVNVQGGLSLLNSASYLADNGITNVP
jgi:subtilisin family serine protease